MLDLNGDGIRTLSLSQGVQFDLDGDGKQEQAGWVSRQDGLLVMDRNGDGIINDGRELFGSGTDLPTGGKAADGFAALATLDSKADGVIDAKDKDFDKLQVWVDGNQDGVSQTSELHSLTSLGITQIDLDAVRADIADQGSWDNGNWVGLQGNYTQDGKSKVIADVWLATQPVDLRASVANLNQALSAYENGNATLPANDGNALNIGQDGKQSPSNGGQVVTNLVDALNAFASNGTPASNPGVATDNPVSQLLGQSKNNNSLAGNGGGNGS